MGVLPGVNVEDAEQRRLLFVDLIAESPDDEVRKTTLEKLEVYIDELIEETKHLEGRIDESNFDEDELDMANDTINELKEEIRELKFQLDKK
jgi:hypothetical protein